MKIALFAEKCKNRTFRVPAGLKTLHKTENILNFCVFCRIYADFQLFKRKVIFLGRNSRFPPEVKNACRSNGLLLVLRPVSLKTNILVKCRFFAQIRYFRKKADFREKAHFLDSRHSYSLLLAPEPYQTHCFLLGSRKERI